MNEKQTMTAVEIISALEYLLRVAKKENMEDIEELIEATFKICLNTYLTLKRAGLEANLPPRKNIKIVAS